MNVQDVLGIDVGGVIIAASNDNTDTSFFSDNYLNSVSVEGVFEAVAHLIRVKFGPNAHIVSKCGLRIETKTRSWLAHHDFYDRTGLPPEHLHFVRKREDKAPVCTEVGITHFVDDRLDVLRHLHDVANRFLFVGHANEIKKFPDVLQQVIYVQNWQEIVGQI